MPNGECQIIGPDRSQIFDVGVNFLSLRHQCENTDWSSGQIIAVLTCMKTQSPRQPTIVKHTKQSKIGPTCECENHIRVRLVFQYPGQPVHRNHAEAMRCHAQQPHAAAWRPKLFPGTRRERKAVRFAKIVDVQGHRHDFALLCVSSLLFLSVSIWCDHHTKALGPNSQFKMHTHHCKG